MIITHKITMDLSARGITPRVDVVQSDQYSRNLEFTLTANGRAWSIPESAAAIVRFRKSDGTGGNYDTLPDGTQAYTINGNVLTVALAPQVCTAPGLVQLAVGLIDGETEINTFTICVNVQRNPGIGVASESYFKIAGALPDSGWTPNMYLGTDADGNVVVKAAPSGGSGGGTITHGVIWDLINVTSSNNVVSVNDGDSLVAVLTPAESYTLGDVTVTMGGEVLTGVWNAETAAVTISSVTGDVVISCAGVEISSIVDTTAKISAYDKGYIEGTQQIDIVDYTGACITEVYPYSHDVDKLKAHASYDATNDCMTGTTMFPRVAYYIPNVKFTEAGNSVQSTKTKIAYSRDGVFCAISSITMNSEATAVVGGKTNDNMYSNGIAFTLFTADVDDSYAYWSVTGSMIAPVGVRHGDIIFAGKNTQYYGMKNIDGTMLGAEATALSVDEDIAQDYSMATTSILGEDLSAEPEAAYGVGSEFAAAIDTVRRAWMKEYGGDWRKIPLIITTDQHGRVYSGVFKLLGKTQNMHEVSKICNLGDTVESMWVDSDADNPLLTYWELDSWMACMSEIPFSKRLDVFGNHDTWYTNADGEEVVLTELPHLNQYFKNIYARRTNNHGWFAVKDDYWNIKYVVVSAFEYTTSRSQYRISTAQMKWLIDEMGKDDGYDIVVVSHVPLYYQPSTEVYPTGMIPSDEGSDSISRVSNVDTDALFNARKNKTSGTVTDSDGVEHSFDFTDCTTDILCGLHGHIHMDGYNYVGGDGLVNATFDYFANETIHFVLIDRVDRQIDVWKIDFDQTPIHYQIPLDKPSE